VFNQYARNEIGARYLRIAQLAHECFDLITADSLDAAGVEAFFTAHNGIAAETGAVVNDMRAATR